ncbi:hypothetical protein H1R20_g12299, partial [Candolleomyces eurysporus]
MLTKLNNIFPLILALLITIQSCNGVPVGDPTEPQLSRREPSSFRFKNPTPDKTSDAPLVNVTEGP